MTMREAKDYKIKLLDFGLLVGPEGSISMVVNQMRGSERSRISIYNYLIEGPGIPLMMVDTGIKEDDLSMFGTRYQRIVLPENTVEYQLAKWGYKKDDVKVIIHTHLHADHCGNDYQFPNAKIILMRQELMWAVGGIQTGYPKQVMLYMVEQSYVPGRMRLLDGDAEIAPGIVLQTCDGHTPGGLIVRVHTRVGEAILCGDVIYSEQLQVRDWGLIPDIKAQSEWGGGIEAFGDWATGNFVDLSKARWWVQKLVREADILLPSHDEDVIRKYGYEIG
jgi:glyoxylase-like metal-dependent hydrolase (beta-lactamase superfamily II)